jgi:hypothetical protein
MPLLLEKNFLNVLHFVDRFDKMVSLRLSAGVLRQSRALKRLPPARGG